MIDLAIIFLSFFGFLFFVYNFSKDDFVILRKDIPLERIFSMAILTGVACLLVARFFYVVFNFKPIFLNPLVFLAIPYFPGLSLIGGVAGSGLFIYVYSTSKKIPPGRLFDLFSMSFISVIPFALILHFLFLRGSQPMLLNIIFIASIVVLLVFYKLLFPFSTKGEIKDGSLGLIYLLIISFVYFIGNLLINLQEFSFLIPENIFILTVFFTSLVLIINQEIMNKYLIKK